MPHVERNGIRVFYEDHGRGLPVLLTHGYAASSRMWGPQVATLASSFRLITWDLRGHGDSDSPKRLEAYAQVEAVGDMIAVLDACGVDRAVIGGLSLGGYLSLEFWLHHPERTLALMLLDTGPGFRKPEGRSEWNAFAERQAQALERKGLAALSASSEVESATHRSVEGLALAARGTLTQRDSRVIEALGTIDVPTLVLWGADDTPFVRSGEAMAAKIPGARKIAIAGAGHAPNLEQPEAFDAAVRSFLETLDA